MTTSNPTPVQRRGVPRVSEAAAGVKGPGTGAGSLPPRVKFVARERLSGHSRPAGAHDLPNSARSHSRRTPIQATSNVVSIAPPTGAGVFPTAAQADPVAASTGVLAAHGSPTPAVTSAKSAGCDASCQTDVGSPSEMHMDDVPSASIRPADEVVGVVAYGYIDDAQDYPYDNVHYVPNGLENKQLLRSLLRESWTLCDGPVCECHEHRTSPIVFFGRVVTDFVALHELHVRVAPHAPVAYHTAGHGTVTAGVVRLPHSEAAAKLYGHAWRIDYRFHVKAVPFAQGLCAYTLTRLPVKIRAPRRLGLCCFRKRPVAYEYGQAVATSFQDFKAMHVRVPVGDHMQRIGVGSDTTWVCSLGSRELVVPRDEFEFVRSELLGRNRNDASVRAQVMSTYRTEFYGNEAKRQARPLFNNTAHHVFFMALYWDVEEAATLNAGVTSKYYLRAEQAIATRFKPQTRSPIAPIVTAFTALMMLFGVYIWRLMQGIQGAIMPSRPRLSWLMESAFMVLVSHLLVGTHWYLLVPFVAVLLHAPVRGRINLYGVFCVYALYPLASEVVNFTLGFYTNETYGFDHLPRQAPPLPLCNQQCVVTEWSVGVWYGGCLWWYFNQVGAWLVATAVHMFLNFRVRTTRQDFGNRLFLPAVCTGRVGLTQYQLSVISVRGNTGHMCAALVGPGQPGVLAVGPRFAGLWPTVYRACAHNLLRAIARRQCLIKARPRGPMIAALNQVAPASFRVCSWDDYYATLEPSQRTILDTWTSDTRDIHLRCRSGAFVKVEKTLNCEPGALASTPMSGSSVVDTPIVAIPVGDQFATVSVKDPRLIQPQSPYCNAVLGPLFKGYSIALQEYWTFQNKREHHNIYASGMTGTALSRFVALSMARGWWVFEFDYSRFDATVHRELLEWEAAKYSLVANQHQCEALAHLGHSYGHGRAKGSAGVVKMSWNDRAGGRRSGVGNTSSGNTTLSGAAISAAATRVGVTNYEAYLLGDDSLVFVRPTPASPDVVAREFADNLAAVSGFRVTGGLRDVTTCTFCSGRFFPSDMGPRYAPFPFKQLAKLFWRITPCDRRHFEWLTQVVVGLANTFSHVLVARAVFGQLLRVCRALPDTTLGPKHKFLHDSGAEAVEESYNFMQAIYGLTRDEINTAELYIASQDTVDYELPPYLLRCVRVDLQ